MPILFVLLIGTTPSEHIAKGRELLQQLDYDAAALELGQAGADPKATDAERLQANLLAGIANRISGHDVEARANFRYVLLRKPDWQLDEQTPPKVAVFFESIRHEILAERAASTAPSAATKDSRAEPAAAISPGVVVAGAIGVAGLAAVVAGSGGLVVAETSLADPTRPGGERTSLRTLGAWSLGGAAIGAVLVGVGAGVFAVSGT